MNEYLNLSVKQLKKHQEKWRYNRSKYIAETLTPDKEKLQAYNRIIDDITELILNRALKEYKEYLDEKQQR